MNRDGMLFPFYGPFWGRCWAFVLMIALGGSPSAAAGTPTCTIADIPETQPRPVDVALLTAALDNLQTIDGERVRIVLTDSLRHDLAELFRQQNPRTKLDQFYRMLYLLAQTDPRLDPPDARTAETHEIFLSGPSVARILQAAAVIDNPDFLARLQQFRLQRLPGRDPFYEVTYAGAETHFPLNQGKGFSIYRNGMCQLTKSLLFRDKFSFRMRLNPKNNNLLVYDYAGVDLYGDFGTRLPLIKIDLNYVMLESVEFIEGTNRGTVKAKVSPQEFEANDHTWLLKVLTRVVSDTSTQPIDW